MSLTWASLTVVPSGTEKTTVPPAALPSRTGPTLATVSAVALAEAEEAMNGMPATARAETAVVARPRLMPLLFMKKEPF